MAKMKRPLGDLPSGKIGNVVFVVSDGESYVRAAPDRKKEGWTPDQQLHRQRFSKATQLWGQVKPALVHPIWNLGAKKMNGYAYFLKANLPAFALDGTLMDARMLQLSTGKLHLPQELKAHRMEAQGTTISVSWKNDPLLKGIRLLDELMVVSLANGKFSAATATGLERGQKSGTFELPPVPGSTPQAPGSAYIYLFFASDVKGDYTGSVCFDI